MRLPLITTVCIFLSQCAVGTLGIDEPSSTVPHIPDMIPDMLKRNIDWNMHPCENFYQHLMMKQRLEEQFEDAKIDAWTSHFRKIEGLRLLGDLRVYLSKELTGEEQKNLSAIKHPISAVVDAVLDQVQKSGSLMSKENLRALEEKIQTIGHVNTLSNLDNWNPLEDAYKKISGIYDTLAAHNMSRDDALEVIIDTNSYLSDISPEWAGLLEGGLHFNSEYLEQSNMYAHFAATILVTLRADLAVKFGATYSVAGHEIYHSVFAAEEEMSDDPKIAKNRDCYIDHIKRVEANYLPDEHSNVPLSGTQTWGEDLPDFEALQTSFKLLQQHAQPAKLVPYKQLPRLTREMLFFYSWAAVWCIPGRRVGDPDDSHSGNFLRVNAPLSLMSSFHKTFQCPKDSRMYKFYEQAPAGKCNQIGEEARRIKADN
ncbi:unnamed protein product, partial [Mesorhabditis spiculigera]